MIPNLHADSEPYFLPSPLNPIQTRAPKGHPSLHTSPAVNWGLQCAPLRFRIAVTQSLPENLRCRYPCIFMPSVQSPPLVQKKQLGMWLEQRWFSSRQLTERSWAPSSIRWWNAGHPAPVLMWYKWPIYLPYVNNKLGWAWKNITEIESASVYQ